MSVFLAVDLDAPTRALTSGLIETHRAMFPKAKWLRTDKLHCTVVFLGNPDSEQMSAFVPKIAELASRHGPITLRLQGSGTFVTARAPSVLWLGVTGALDRLSALYFDAHASMGVEPREFVPHVTLARIQQAGGFDGLRGELSSFSSGEFTADRLSLYESSSEVYRVVHSWPLEGRGS